MANGLLGVLAVQDKQRKSIAQTSLNSLYDKFLLHFLMRFFYKLLHRFGPTLI